MGSFKGNGRDEGSKRRAAENRRLRQGILNLESLEQRRLLSGNTSTGWHSTNTNPYDATNGPLANLGPITIEAYREFVNFEAAGGKGNFTSPLSKYLAFKGTSIGLDVRGTGDFNTFKQAMVGLGLTVTAASPTLDEVEGWAPLASVLAIAQQGQTIGGTPVFKPITKFVGSANNQADQALFADVARQTYGVDGTGQKVGIISDSFSRVAPGYAGSIASGDLPNNVQILQDADPGTGADEGRAMAELIHDIAPGASLAFATGDPTAAQPNGDLGFATNIAALAAVGSRTIVDDLGSPTDLYYQDGIIQQAVNTFVAGGGTYLSSSGNSSDSGYQSQFRPAANATVAGVGTGTFMNFDPTGATTATTLAISVYKPTTPIFQFDQPVVAGSNTSIQSQVNFYVLDQNNNVVGSGTANNRATQSPIQFLQNGSGQFVTLPVGTYKVAIQVVGGPNPGHVVFYEPGNGGFNVDHQYGTAGGTFYPTDYGHAAGASTISVSAVPWFNAPPFQNPAVIHTEDFSDFGPYLQVFNPDGSAKAAPLTLLKPDVSAPDGGNTSFFGQVMNTTTPPFPGHPSFPGQPATTVGQTPTATNLSQNLPSFFGTSAASPNLAAVVALMKQANPNITQPAILSALIASTTPVNGAAKGVWNAQGGYGLVSAPRAIAAASVLQVASISPGAGQALALAPQFITVTFNKPVVLASIAPGALVVAGPNGATVTVGTPVGVDDPANPTIVRFPITITPAPGQVANGLYRTTILAGTITGTNGQVLATGINDSFTLAQTNGPQITGVAYAGRIVQVTFSEPVNPLSVNQYTLALFRTGGVTQPTFGPNDIIVNQLPGARTFLDPTGRIAIIDLTALPQSSLPTDHYGLIANTLIVDGVGNPLNGQFRGVFPSGNFPAGNGSNFFQDDGIVALQPPKVSYLALAPQSDTGIKGDNNTSIKTPSFIGQIVAQFPTAIAGQLVYAEFNGISHPGVARGGLDLNVGANGRGFVGHFDVQTVTDANGQFIVNYPPGFTPLPEGQNRIRIVVVGQPDQPPFPGFASVQDTAFRIDNTLPYVGTIDGSQPTSIPQNANINGLANLSISIVDPVNPTTLGDPFAVDPRLGIPALDPTAANNVSNYRLFKLVNGTMVDESSFLTSATFVSTSARTLSSDPFTGKINFAFAPGLPTGNYVFEIRSAAFAAGGITDAAGNPFTVNAQASALGLPFNFGLYFSLQPTPTYITAYAAYSPDAALGYVQTDVRSNYEIPVPGVTPRANAAPTLFSLDFSNTLNLNADYTNTVQLYRSANTPNSLPDGDFGDLGITNTTGFTRVTGLTVYLADSVPGATFGQYGYRNRLVVVLPAGATLPADYYRIYLPNNGPSAITDVFGNQLDGEFKGYKDATGTYVDLLPTGQVRGTASQPDLSGDGTPGGAFVSGFVVVPNGNILFARADTIYNPQIPALTPTGAFDRPYSTLAPEAIFTANNGGDLNSVVNSGANFNTSFDRNGDGAFEPSAFFAAQQRVQATGGPVVIIAKQSIPSRDPITGGLIQKAFVLQAPSGSDPIVNDGSASVPALTTLVLQEGAILKLQNASLFVQNQGSALQVLGGPNAYQTVTVTSYKDSTVGGVSNGDPSTIGAPGDYGGIVFRNFSQAAIPGSNTPRTTLFPGQIAATSLDGATPDFAFAGRLKGQFRDSTNPASQADAVSGADDVMSYVSYLTERYAGGAVPQTIGIRYDGITLKNARPTIINSSITDTNGQDGSSQAGISADVDSLRVDDTAQGPLIRNDVFLRNGLNGIYIRAEIISGIAEPTNAVAYPTNPSTNGGASNYILDNPYPYLLTSRMVIGRSLQQETGGSQSDTTDRLYINPGMVLKFEHGAALQILSTASINVGDTTYIKQYDANHLVGPTQAATLANGQPNPLAGQKTQGFAANSAGLAQAIFTSLNDDVASTSYFDPISQATTTIVQPLPAVPGGSGALQPKPGNVPAAARWGGLFVASGGVAVINSTIFRYGGGAVNTAPGTGGLHVLEVGGGIAGLGARVMVTNDVFNDNLDVPINLQPDSLLAGDPQRPLNSGNPYIHGNVFVSNGINGVGVQGGTDGFHNPNLHVNSVWTGTDFTYILRDTIVLDGRVPNLPSSTVLQPIPTPAVTLTLQSTAPGTILADGTTIASPGVPLLVKLLNVGTTPPAETPGTNPATNQVSYYQGGAGFIVGVDDGTDPPTPLERLIDNGAFSQIRILGIGGNQTTGQTRVPVIITSIHDSTVGTTVNNTQMFQAIPGDTTAPKGGDGGVIYYGGNSLTNYNLQDPRSGSLIDNADIKYITRIEQQGGGIIYTYDLTGANSFTPGLDSAYGTKLGYFLNGTGTGGVGAVGYADQYNQAKQLTISNSNLSTFSDAAFRAHPGYAAITVAGNYVVQNGPFVRVGGYLGEATHTYFVNNTISNMPLGADLVSEVSDNTNFPSPAMAVFLNNTFYNITGDAIKTTAPVFNGINDLSHVSFLAMDNIFSKIGANAAESTGQNYGSDLQYNLFDQIGGQAAVGVGNNQPIVGSPAFRDAANGNFFLLPTSAAIDVARSELGPSIFGDMLYPASTINNANLKAIPIRNVFGDPNSTTGIAGDINPFGGAINFVGGFPLPVDIVTLPGEPVNERGFPDQWIPVLQTSTATGASAGTGTNPATFIYAPLQGERDQVGNLRVKDPNSPSVGFGSRPFFDLGAFEYIIQNPPVVTAVNATTTGGTVSTLYKANGIAGVNQAPQTIQIGFNERLDPTTISGMSVILQASGGDGIFGNANSPADRTINLSGLLSFDNTTNTLVINTASIFTNAATLNDEYKITLKGTGSSVIRDKSGLALDGYTANDTLPLPSGSDQFPGSDFVVSFTISTQSPIINNGTFALAPTSDTSGGRGITRNNLPTFNGSITATFPPINAASGQAVHIDISTRGDGVFDLLDAGVGTTDINGNFSVTLTKVIPDTPNTIGTNGIQGGPGATYAIARLRVINQAGNASNLPTDPLSAYIAKGAVAYLEVDTRLPQITAFNPLANTVATVNASGQVIVTVTFSENIRPSSLNPSSIQVFRSGGTGSFLGAGVTAVPINTGTFTASYAPSGAETVSFAIQGPLPNDVYEVILKGTGATPVTDPAGNPLSGAFTGSFPTGGTSNQGSDFVLQPFSVYQRSRARLIYVQAPVVGAVPGTGTPGTRANPFTTIAAAMNSAVIGDNVLVLPGTYKEDVVVKPGVRLLSAAASSTDAGYLPGNANQTLIYGALNPVNGVVPTVNPGNNYITTVTVSGSIVGVPTEVSGFSIISPLIGDPTLGTIDPTYTAISALNSNVLIDRNNIINAGVGVLLVTSGASAQTAQVFDNVIAGNIVGIGINDNGTTSIAAPYLIANNTIAFNTYGLVNTSGITGTAANPFIQAYVLNDIFYANHALTLARTGTGIASNTANTLAVGYDLFFDNGPSSRSSADDATGSFGSFNPAALGATPDPLHNFTGNPAFVAARDPRPNGDTPALFFTDGNFDLTGRSVAINAANNLAAPATDYLYRTAVTIAGKGFPGTGPASIGAYYYLGTGGPVGGGGSGGGSGGLPIVIVGTGVGGSGNGIGGDGNPITPIGIPLGAVSSQSVNSGVPMIGGGAAIGTKKFNVVNTSLSPEGTALASDVLGVIAPEAAPTFIDINFSNDINASTLSPSDLILSGNGLDAANPARATGLAWIDSHAVRFILSGGFANGGTVNVSIPNGAITDTRGDAFAGYADAFQVASGGTSNASGFVPLAGASSLALAQPVAVANPVATAASVVAHPAKHQAAKVAHAASKKHDQHHATPKVVVHHAATPKAPKPAHPKATVAHATHAKAKPTHAKGK